MSNIQSKQAKAQAEKTRQDNANVRELTLDIMGLREEINIRRRDMAKKIRQIEGILGYSRDKSRPLQN